MLKPQEVTEVSLLRPSQGTSRTNHHHQEPESRLRGGTQAIFLNNQIWKKHNVLRGLSHVFHASMWKSVSLNFYKQANPETGNQPLETHWQARTPLRLFAYNPL